LIKNAGICEEEGAEISLIISTTPKHYTKAAVAKKITRQRRQGLITIIMI
jgi:hypothetical protein